MRQLSNFESATGYHSTSKLRVPLEPLQDRVCSTKFHYTWYQRQKRALTCERGRGTVGEKAWCKGYVAVLVGEVEGLRRFEYPRDPGPNHHKRGPWLPCVNAQEHASSGK